jgi:iron complex transport system substrate-binding protein
VTSKIIAALIVLAFGWAIVRSGDVSQTEDRVNASTRGTRTKRPTSKQLAKLLECEEDIEDARVVKHVLGTTSVPLHPERIVSLSSSATDAMVALGVPPLMIEEDSRIDGPRTYLAKGLRTTQRIRGGQILSLENIAKLQPDLIFVSNGQNARLYEQCSHIAPTVPIGSAAQSNRERRILDVGAVLGMTEEAETRLEECLQFVERAKKMLAEQAKDKPVVFLRFRKNTCVIYTQTAMFGPLLFKQLGLTPDPRMPVAGASGGWDVLSLERLSLLTSEYIFYVLDRDSENYLKNISETPIWREIPAVKHGHVHRVASGTWLSGDGVLGCEAIVRDVLDAVVPDWKEHAGK